VILYHTTYQVTFDVATREGDPPSEVQLRHFLKNAWRAWGIRCRRIAEVPSETAIEAEAADGGAGVGDR
jgi:hypothetical protein